MKEGFFMSIEEVRLREKLNRQEENIKEIINKNIELTGENMKLKYENEKCNDKITELEVKLDLKEKKRASKKKSMYFVVEFS